MKSNKNTILAIIVTLLFHVLLVLILVTSHLTYTWPPKDAIELEKLPQEEIMFGGEFVQLGNVEAPASQDLAQTSPAEAPAKADEPKVEGHDLKDAGEAQDKPKQVVTTKQESPMKVQKKEEPKKTEPKGTTKSEQTEADKTKAQQEAQRKQIASRMKFGSTNGSGSGQTGSPNGNSDSGARSGKPGIGGLGGYTLDHWSRPTSSVEGTIIISVKVNARGNVTSASYAGGSGSAAANIAARNSCIAAAKASTFSMPKNTTTDAVGTITYRFE